MPFIMLNTLRPLVRYLRILWSMLFGILCVLLLGLWVRSYSHQDTVGGRFTRLVFSASSVRARVVSQFAWVPPAESGFSLKVNSEDIDNFERMDAELLEMSNKLGFGFFQVPAPCLTLPHWFAVLTAAGIAAIPWIRWTNRFSLRTLLIFTTLIAVVLGLILWASRS